MVARIRCRLVYTAAGEGLLILEGWSPADSSGRPGGMWPTMMRLGGSARAGALGRDVRSPIAPSGGRIGE